MLKVQWLDRKEREGGERDSCNCLLYSSFLIFWVLTMSWATCVTKGPPFVMASVCIVCKMMQQFHSLWMGDGTNIIKSLDFVGFFGIISLNGKCCLVSCFVLMESAFKTRPLLLSLIGNGVTFDLILQQ